MSCTGRSSHGLTDIDLLGEAMSETDGPLPCPFCGPDQSCVDAHFDDHVSRWRVTCGRCGASSGITPRKENDSRSVAVSRWNARAPAPAGLEVYEADRSAREACMEIAAQHQCGECDAALKIIDAIRRTITPSPAAREVERLKREVDTAEKQRDNLYFEVERLRAENEKLWRAVKAWEAESLGGERGHG